MESHLQGPLKNVLATLDNKASLRRSVALFVGSPFGHFCWRRLTTKQMLPRSVAFLRGLICGSLGQFVGDTCQQSRIFEGSDLQGPLDKWPATLDDEADVAEAPGQSAGDTKQQSSC